MAVYNGDPFLGEAIRSILAQTCVDFELLIIDDGSTDESVRVVESFSDGRIRLHRGDRNEGLVSRLNWGLDEARGRYVARMDADDIAHPTRLERQLAFMRTNPKVGICGTWFTCFSPEISWLMCPPQHHAAIGARMLFENPVGHPTVMFDLAQMNRHGLRYSRDAAHAEDYDLWVRAHARLIMANLPEALHNYRIHQGSVGARFGPIQSEVADRARIQALGMSGVHCDPTDLVVHRVLSAAVGLFDGVSLDQATAWALRVRRSVGVWGAKSRAIRRECDARLEKLRRSVASA